MADVPVPSIATATPAAEDTIVGVKGGAVRRFLVSALGSVITFLQAGTGAVTRTMQDKLRDTISVTDFGAVGDGATDDSAAIALANAAAASLAGALIGGYPTRDVTLLFPSGRRYAIASTITLSHLINVKMEGAVVYTGTANEPAIVIGSAANYSSGRHHELRVSRSTQSDWSNEENIGIRLFNTFNSRAYIARASNFTIGFQVMGDSRGCAYNEFSLGELINNKVAVDVTNRDSLGGVGYANENVFTAGRFSSNSGVNSTLDRYGVRLNSLSATKYINNNNVFLKPCFELNNAGTGKALPVLCSYGQGNHFIEVRSEGNDLPFMRQENASSENSVSFGYCGLADEDKNDSAIIETTGTFPVATITRSRNRHLEKVMKLVFDSGPMHKTACYYDGGTTTHIPGVHAAATASSAILQARGGVTYSDRYIECSASYVPGIYVDTQKVKRFCVRADVEASNPGRVYVQCFNAAGTLLTNAGPGHPYVRGSSFQSMSWSSSFAGCYSTGGDDSQDTWFEVGPDVSYIAVRVGAGSAAIRIRRFQIYAGDLYGAPATWTGIEEVVRGQNIGTAAPTAGTWAKGRTVWNASPDAGEPLGWTCVVAGTPGTWVPFGGIQSANAYTVTNVTTDRAFDADTVAITELADVVGTLIADLKASGILK